MSCERFCHRSNVDVGRTRKVIVQFIKKPGNVFGTEGNGMVVAPCRSVSIEVRFGAKHPGRRINGTAQVSDRSEAIDGPLQGTQQQAAAKYCASNSIIAERRGRIRNLHARIRKLSGRGIH